MILPQSNLETMRAWVSCFIQGILQKTKRNLLKQGLDDRQLMPVEGSDISERFA